MSINTIGFNFNIPSGSNGLSEETRRKLLSLGIDPSTVTSEAQAKKLIDKAQNIPAVEKSQKAETQNSCSSEQELLYKAKLLASKIGISSTDNTPLDEILTLISSKLEQMTITAKDDKTKLAQINAYNQELLQITDKYSHIQQNIQAMYTSMNFNANINKMLLGL